MKSKSVVIDFAEHLGYITSANASLLMKSPHKWPPTCAALFF